MLLCGAAKANISPDLPVHLVGYRPDLVATGIHDDLHVAALYLEDRQAPLVSTPPPGLRMKATNPVGPAGLPKVADHPGGKGRGERLAVLTYDLATLDAEFVAELQGRCAAATGLPERSILTTVSHSHSTPSVRPHRSTRGPTSPRYSKEYRARVLDRSVEALEEAVRSAVDVEVYYNYTHIRENLNRRVFFPSGEYYYQPKQKNLLAVADGPVDDEIGMVYFCRGPRHTYVATVVNYTAHALTVGDTSTEVTADYPGVLKREVEANLGGIALFINGACGDNHPLGAEAGFGRCERMGLALAEKVLYHRWDSVKLEDPPVGSDYREVVLPVMSEEEHARVPANYGTGRRRQVREELLVDGGVRTYFSLWAVGPILFFGGPGEMTAELGLRLKWESPFPKTYVMEIATDHVGYIPHRNAYEWGGYEACTSPFGPAAGAKLCSEMLSAAEELKARMETGGRRVALPGKSERPGPS